MATPAAESAAFKSVISTRMPRLGSPVRISFAPGTNFEGRRPTRIKEATVDPTYTIKPVHRQKNVMKFKAPASTAPSLPYLTTSQNDFRDPQEQIKRLIHPGSQWFYRTQSDLLTDSKDEEDILAQGRRQFLPQFVNKVNSKGRAVSDTVAYTMKGYDYSSHQRVEAERAASAALQRTPFNTGLGPRLYSGTSLNSSNSSFQDYYSNFGTTYKPLVGNSNDRVIENARLVHITPVPQNQMLSLPPSSFSSTKVPSPNRKSNFTNSLNVMTKHNPLYLDRAPIQRPYNKVRSLDESYRNQQRSLRRAGTEASFLPNLQRQKTSLYDLDKSMERTFKKQAIMKELIGKNN